MTRVVYVVEVDGEPVDMYRTEDGAIEACNVFTRGEWGRSGKVVRYVPAAKNRKGKR